MSPNRRLALRREALAPLDAAELGGIAAGVPTWQCPVTDTCYSCLDYVSCDLAYCLTISS